MPQEIKGQGIQSLEVGLAILKKIAAEKRPLTITHIAEICEMPKSKVHHYLTSFCRSGFLIKGEDLKYTLGSELVLLGLEAVDAMDISEVAVPYLKEISDAVNETVYLSLWGLNGPFFVRSIESKRAINIGIRVGSQVSVTKSSSGKVFAAFLRNEETAALIKRELEQNQMEPESFEQDIREIQEKGYARSDSTIAPGIAGISCPVFNRKNQIVATVTILALSGTMDTSENAVTVRSLKENCLKLSIAMGFKG
ncbi:IclR family transcriptional regulator [Paenibacillus sp. CF384]|uniref:IclR family transcriptional regulator n=1 Tax=Paenibacillus sp. CF384 TaxID=1884382 RepID=UPI00089A4A26|nr:IclR family transcriptional regulator [Paenibacillus sp. CF384]SDW47606.1 transcriptional regulator, IclR family [Paenibacillus sp. CF384]